MNKKIQKSKLGEMMELCKEGVEGISVLAFNPEKVVNVARSDVKFSLPVGFYYSKRENHIELVGNILGTKISSINTDLKDHKNENEHFRIFVSDTRNEKKISFYTNDDLIKKLNKKFHPNGSFTTLVYWENADLSYLAYAIDNPLDSNLVVDAIFVTEKFLTDANRAICLKLLDENSRKIILNAFHNASGGTENEE